MSMMTSNHRHVGRKTVQETEFGQHGRCALHETATINGSAIHMSSGKFTAGGIDMVCALSHISKYARM